MRPRRRKARRLEQHGQNGFEDCVRLRDRDGLAFRQSRFRYASREDQYDGDYDTGSERKYGRNVDWDDQNSDYFDYGRDGNRKYGNTQASLRQTSSFREEERAAVVVHKQHPRMTEKDGEGSHCAASFKQFVTFYIINFPPQASIFFLA